MVFIIAGMHRSGTSMIARLLNLCGVYLGKETDLIPAANDNPEGFWENAKFQAINEEILTSFGGSWDTPPLLEMGWESSSHLVQMYPRVDQLLKEFSGYRVWGWKDPRNSLTLPYWKKQFPNLKVVVCLRNPYDVYRSLTRRAYASSTFAYNLWLSYHQSLLDATDVKSRIVTHFESYFSDPKSELRRLVDYLGIDVSDETLETACKTISAELKHNHSSISSLLETSASSDLLKIYKGLCFEAGPVYRTAISPEEMELFDNINVEKEKTLKDYERLVTILKSEIRARDTDITQKNKEISSLRTELRDIYGSRSWRLVKFMRKILFRGGGAT